MLFTRATNEELESTNAELRLLTQQVEGPNKILQSVLATLKHGVIVLDASSHVRVWNQKAEQLWGCRVDEVMGKPFFDLDIGLPLNDLSEHFKQAQQGQAVETLVPAINRLGRHFNCEVKIKPLDARHKGGMLVLTLEHHSK